MYKYNCYRVIRIKFFYISLGTAALTGSTELAKNEKDE